MSFLPTSLLPSSNLDPGILSAIEIELEVRSQTRAAEIWQTKQ